MPRALRPTKWWWMQPSDDPVLCGCGLPAVAAAIHVGCVANSGSHCCPRWRAFMNGCSSSLAALRSTKPQGRLNSRQTYPTLTLGYLCCNASSRQLTSALCRVLADCHQAVSYCLPISDDGGSSAEILRHLGGPAIGDLRSRLLRLAQSETAEQQAVLALLQFRLPRDSAAEARREWLAIVEVRPKLCHRS